MADRLLQDMKLRAIEPDIDCLHWAIQCWSRTKRKDATERIEGLYADLWDKIRGATTTLPLPLTRQQQLQDSLNCLLQAYQGVSNAHRAEELLLDLAENFEKTKAVPPTLDMCKSVLSTWPKSNSSRRASRAEKLLTRMRADPNLPDPDISCYTFVLSCWASSGKPKAPHRAESLLRQMENTPASTQPTLQSYTCVLNAWSRTEVEDAPEQAERLLREIKEKGFKPDRIVYTAMISVWGRSSKRRDSIVKAEGYLEELKGWEAVDDDPPKATVVEYTALIQAWANYVAKNLDASRRAVDRVEELLQEMLSASGDDLRPNRMTFAAILRTIGAARRIPDRGTRADAALRQMEALRLEPTTYIRNLHQKCAKSPSKKDAKETPKKSKKRR